MHPCSFSLEYPGLNNSQIPGLTECRGCERQAHRMAEAALEPPAPLHVEYCPITGVPAEFNDLLPK